MNISTVKLREIRLRLLNPFETSFGTCWNRRILLVEVHHESGEIGWGECIAPEEPYYCEEWTDSAWSVLTSFLIPLILSSNIKQACEIRGLFANIQRNMMAKAAIETAVWDLEAKLNEESLWKHIGGDLKPVPCGVSIGIQESLERLFERILKEYSAGYQRIKLKIKPGWDVSIVSAVRERFPDIVLMVDANGAYTIRDIETFRMLDDLRLLMIEQPLEVGDLSGHALLQSELKTAICLDESITSTLDARSAIRMGSCRIINIKVGRVGGYAEALSVVEECTRRNVPVWCGGMHESGIGRAHNIAAACLKGFDLPNDISASDRYWERDVIKPTISVNRDGTLTPPLAKGIGFEVDRDLIETLTVRSFSASARNI